MYSSLGKQLLSFNLAGGQEVCVHVLFSSPDIRLILIFGVQKTGRVDSWLQSEVMRPVSCTCSFYMSMIFVLSES